MTNKFAFFLGTAIFLSACNIGLDEANREISSESQPAQPSKVGDKEVNGACFELKMEKWYEAFHKFQSEGNDMFLADKKAWEVANQEFEDCNKGTREQLATGGSSKE